MLKYLYRWDISFSFFFFLKKIFFLIKRKNFKLNVLLSGTQQGDSVIHTYIMYILYIYSFSGYFPL